MKNQYKTAWGGQFSRQIQTRAGTTSIFRWTNTRWVSDGSYLALKNLTFGYTIPVKSNPYIKSTRFYFSAQNVFMLTNYRGMNPEVGANGSNGLYLSLIHISEPTRLGMISYAVFCL